MANTLYNRFFYNLLCGLVDHDSGGDAFKVGLLKTTHAIDKDDNTWADVSADEVVGTGYTAGGEAITNIGVTQDDTNDLAYWDVQDVTWTSVTLTGANAPQFAVIYDTTVSNNLVCLIDFGSGQECNGGDFKIIWDSNGVLKLQQA